METIPPTTKLSEPFRYVAKERCHCGKEEVTPAEWELVAQKNREYGEFLIRDEKGEMWRHLPLRLGGCAKRERAVEGFRAPDGTGSPSYPVMDSRMAAFPDRPEQPPLKPIEPLNPQGEGGEHMEGMKEMTIVELARLAGVKTTSIRTRLLRKGIQVLQRKTETGLRIAYVAGKDVPRAIEEAKAIRPRGARKQRVRSGYYGSPAHLAAGAYAREVLGLKRLHDKGILGDEEHQAALNVLREKFNGARPAVTDVVRTATTVSSGGSSTGKALELIRRVLEQNNITMLRYENGRLTARRSITTQEEMEG